MSREGTNPSLKRCAFCRQPGVTREHVWPQWLLRLVESPGKSLLGVAHQVRNSSGELVEKSIIRMWESSKLDLTVRAVCAACNNGWMSTLESRSMIVMRPLIEGRRVVLDQQDQILVAFWAQKTISILSLASPLRSVPHSHLSRLYHSRGPLAESSVWLAQYHAKAAGLWARERRLDLQSEADLAQADLPHGYLTTLRIGELVIQVCGYSGEGHLRLPHASRIRGHIIQIWPVKTGRRRWPPMLGSLSDVELDDLAAGPLARPA
jgi:hypothetical protein